MREKKIHLSIILLFLWGGSAYELSLSRAVNQRSKPGEETSLECHMNQFLNDCSFYGPNRKKICENSGIDGCQSSNRMKAEAKGSVCRLKIDRVEEGDYGNWICETDYFDNKLNSTVTLREYAEGQIQFENFFGDVVMEANENREFVCRLELDDLEDVQEKETAIIWTITDTSTGKKLYTQSQVVQIESDEVRSNHQMYLDIKFHRCEISCRSPLIGQEEKISLELFKYYEDNPKEVQPVNVPHEGATARVEYEFDYFPALTSEQVTWDLGNGVTLHPTEKSGKYIVANQIEIVDRTKHQVVLVIDNFQKDQEISNGRILIKYSSMKDSVIVPFSVKIDENAANPDDYSSEKGGSGLVPGGESEESENEESEEPVAAESMGYIIIIVIVLVCGVLCFLYYCTSCCRKKDADKKDVEGGKVNQPQEKKTGEEEPFIKTEEEQASRANGGSKPADGKAAAGEKKLESKPIDKNSSSKPIAGESSSKPKEVMSDPKPSESSSQTKPEDKKIGATASPSSAGSGSAVPGRADLNNQPSVYLGDEVTFDTDLRQQKALIDSGFDTLERSLSAKRAKEARMAKPKENEGQSETPKATDQEAKRRSSGPSKDPTSAPATPRSPESAKWPEVHSPVATNGGGEKPLTPSSAGSESKSPSRFKTEMEINISGRTFEEVEAIIMAKDENNNSNNSVVAEARQPTTPGVPSGDKISEKDEPAAHQPKLEEIEKTLKLSGNNSPMADTARNVQEHNPISLIGKSDETGLPNLSNPPPGKKSGLAGVPADEANSGQPQGPSQLRSGSRGSSGSEDDLPDNRAAQSGSGIGSPVTSLPPVAGGVGSPKPKAAENPSQRGTPGPGSPSPLSPSSATSLTGPGSATVKRTNTMDSATQTPRLPRAHKQDFSDSTDSDLDILPDVGGKDAELKDETHEEIANMLKELNGKKEEHEASDASSNDGKPKQQAEKVSEL